jgi:tetratricopeptide (TPR) repeat protein
MSLSPDYTKNIKIVFIYSSSGRQDENLRQDLERHLSTLKYSGVFMEWCKSPLDTSHFSDSTNNHTFNILNTFDVVALLVNPQLISLIQNTTSFSNEIQHILQRGKQEEIIVVPLLMREIHNWEKVLGDLNPLPKSRIAVKKSSDTDGAFHNIAEGLEEIIQKIKQYYQNLQEYRQIFYTVIQDEYPLSTQTLNTLIKFKQNWELKNKDTELIEQEITAQAKQEYNQKLQRYKQEFFQIIRRGGNSLSEQDRERLKTLQNDLSLKNEVVASIENEVTENISLQPFRRLIGYGNQANPSVVITAIMIVVVALFLGFCKPSPEAQLTNLENQGQNQPKISAKNIDYMKRGNDHYSQKNYQAAIKDYTQAIEIAPKNVNAYIQRGYAQYYIQKYQAAIDDYTTAIRLFPDLADAYNNRGFVYDTNLRNKQQAIKDYQKAATLYEKQGAKNKLKKMRSRLKSLQQKKSRFSN